MTKTSNRKVTTVTTTTKTIVRNDPRVSGRSLQGLPTYNGRAITAESIVTKAIIRNIRSRRSFKGGREFINAVVESMQAKFPGMTQKSLDGRVCRALARFFA